MSPRAKVTVGDVLRALDERFPFARRAEWDNVGLLLGDAASAVKSVLIALDATPAALAECRRGDVDLLVTHHPVIFTPLKTVRPEEGGAAYALLRMGTAAICAHTNADLAPGGVSHAAARRIGLRRIRPLVPGGGSDACKVAVFCPPGREDALMSAIAESGGGRIGAYSRCSFRTSGWGTFLPATGARPYRGKEGREERVEEVRLETVVPRSLLSRTLRAVRDAHPYEEPAIDVYPLSDGALGGGLGVVGDLPAPATLGRVLEEIDRRIRPSWIRVAGPARRTVKRVAVASGSGAEFYGAARAAGADLFVTGDMKYHQALEAAAGDMPVADIGHGSSEKWILPEFQRAIEERFGDVLSARVHWEEEPLREYRGGESRGGTRP